MVEVGREAFISLQPAIVAFGADDLRQPAPAGMLLAKVWRCLVAVSWKHLWRAVDNPVRNLLLVVGAPADRRHRLSRGLDRAQMRDQRGEVGVT